MATLTGQQIDQSYQGLIKTNDNAALSATAKGIQDGTGGATNIEMSNTATNFVSGTVDFTGATVSGLPTATAGLVEGTGTDSLQNAVGTASNASGAASIALGKNSTASGSQSMAYGEEALANNVSAAAFGQYAEATSTYAIAFGRTAAASGDGSVAFGQQTSAAQAGAVAMGRQVTSDTADTTHVRALKIVAPDGAALGGNGITLISPDGTEGVVTLLDTDELALDGTAIGGGGGAAGLENGTGTSSLQSAASLTTTAANAGGNNAIALGNNARVPGGSDNIAIGNGAQVNATANNSQAFGENAAANSSDATAIGNGTDAGLGGTALGTFAQASGTYSIAVGKNANASATEATAIGRLASATTSGATAIGRNVTATIADTVSVKALETQTDSTPTAGGIIMSDAGATDRRININASGGLQVDGNVVGAAVTQNATRTTLAGPSATDTIITSITIPAGTYTAGDIVEIWAMYTMDYTGGGTNYIAAQISNSASFNTGNYYALGSASSTSDAGWIMNKHLVINVADGTGLGTDSAAVDSLQDIDTLTGSFQYGDNLGKSMDWTSAVYIHFTGFVDNASSSTTLNAGYAKKVN